LADNVHAINRFVEEPMAKYKYIDTQPRLIAVDLSRQLLPGTFEHALNHLLDHDVDLAHFDARFQHDETGAPAYPPAVLLKVVLFAYSQGIVSSRAIERACQEHVTFMALCGDDAPHFTTIARFISTRSDEIARVFVGVLAVCDAEGLIGREMARARISNGTRRNWKTRRARWCTAIVRRTARRPSRRRRRRRSNSSRNWNAMPSNCARGSRAIQRIGAAPKARSVRAIAPITRVRKWQPAKA